MEISIIDTLRTSFTMIILVGCSVLALTFIFERWLYYKHTSIDADRFFMKVKFAFQNEGPEKAITVCNSSLSPLAAVVKSGLEEAQNN